MSTQVLNALSDVDLNMKKVDRERDSWKKEGKFRIKKRDDSF